MTARYPFTVRPQDAGGRTDIQGSAHGRSTRALAQPNLRGAEIAAKEMGSGSKGKPGIASLSATGDNRAHRETSRRCGGLLLRHQVWTGIGGLGTIALVIIGTLALLREPGAATAKSRGAPSAVLVEPQPGPIPQQQAFVIDFHRVPAPDQIWLIPQTGDGVYYPYLDCAHSGGTVGASDQRDS